jgi:DNA mismatch repair protein MutL
LGKINVLDKHVAELIAAGEVVERPSSVIKELVENAIDADSSAITVEIKNGGITYMRVTDNGCGIAREDVPLAFLRHATSKVHVQDDLEGISTLGFRGEALASVAAVAHVELITRTQEELAGTRYCIDGGEEQSCEDAGCAPGSTIIVRDLFYNTPARMKFLKKDLAEANAVAGILDRIALSHPEISLRFLRDSRETLHTPGDGKLQSAIYSVFGKEFAQGLIPVDYELNGVKVWGFVSKPAFARPNRSMQQFYINGRFVKSRTAMVAMEEAFKGSLMVGKVPACVLHLAVTPGAVDVNVHPAKIEVRFINERPIFDAVYHGVKTALNEGDTPGVLSLNKPALSPFAKPEPPVQMRFGASPAAGAVPPGTSVPKSERMPESPALARDFSVRDVQSPAFHPDYEVSLPEYPVPRPETTKTAEPETPWPRESEPEEMSAIPAAKEEPPQEIIGSKPQRPEEKPEKFVGEAFGTYIILQRGEDELVLIDKHAAHERMLYEQLKAQGGQAVQQMLLSPVPVTLDKGEYTAVLEAEETLAEAGFEIDDFGSGTVLVRSAPLILGGEDVADAVMEMAGYLLSAKNDITTEKLDWLYHNVACRAAVKAGDESSPQELAALARRMEAEDVRYCPHGRPVSFLLKKKDLERQFGRV